MGLKKEAYKEKLRQDMEYWVSLMLSRGFHSILLSDALKEFSEHKKKHVKRIWKELV